MISFTKLTFFTLLLLTSPIQPEIIQNFIQTQDDLTINLNESVPDHESTPDFIYIQQKTATYSIRLGDKIKVHNSIALENGDTIIKILWNEGIILTSNNSFLFLCRIVTLSDCKKVDISTLTLFQNGIISYTRKLQKNFLVIISSLVKSVGRIGLDSLQLEKFEISKTAIGISQEIKTPFYLIAFNTLSQYVIFSFENKRTNIDLSFQGEWKTVSIIPDPENSVPGSHFFLTSTCVIVQYSTTHKLITKFGKLVSCEIKEVEGYTMEKIPRTRYAAVLLTSYLRFLHLDYYLSTYSYNAAFTFGGLKNAKSVSFLYKKSLISVSTTKGIYFLRAETNTLCHFNCFSCESGLRWDTCTACRQGYTLIEKNCVLSDCIVQKKFYFDSSVSCYENCPEYYYPSKKLSSCLECPPQCKQCKDDKNCLKCNERFVLMPDGSCGEECPTLYFLNRERVCEKCNETCKECNGPEGRNCTECSSERSLNSEKRCTLPIGDKNCNKLAEYFNKEINRCELCSEGCLGCTGPEKDQCTSCRENLFLLNQSLCVNKCPQGTFQKENKCENCKEGCKICKDNNLCEECKENFELINNSKKENFCKKKCPAYCEECDSISSCKKCEEAYELSEDKKKCEFDCGENCIKCTKEKCEICKENFIPKISKLGCKRICTENCAICENEFCKICEDGYRVINQGKQCEAFCVEGCEVCSSGSKCKICKKGFSLSKSGNKCKQTCIENCAVCKSSQICETCSNGYLLSTSGKNCKKICSRGCLDCSDWNNCINCEEGFELENGYCQISGSNSKLDTTSSSNLLSVILGILLALTALSLFLLALFIFFFMKSSKKNLVMPTNPKITQEERLDTQRSEARVFLQESAILESTNNQSERELNADRTITTLSRSKNNREGNHGLFKKNQKFSEGKKFPSPKLKFILPTEPQEKVIIEASLENEFSPRARVKFGAQEPPNDSRRVIIVNFIINSEKRGK